MDRRAVAAWLERYVEAWRTYDPERIGELFAPDARYRYAPYDEDEDVVRGRDAIVANWLAPGGDEAARDAPGTWEARYEPWAVEGDRAVVVGETHYRATREAPARTYHNVFLLEFDAEGRCRLFTEYYMKAPDRSP
ncbi:MAG TPA: nuclear transport factor 2 family protein [Candidatus Limnocylindrales bacterium]|nr:nuclear transport factor 2 family protein [Candidatus Limnocylindrales bacterium]